MCGGRYQEEGFHYFDVAAVMVEANGELAVHDKLLRKLPQLEARRDERTEGKRQAVETPGRYEEIARPIGGEPWCSGLRAPDHGDLRGQEVLREEPVEKSRGCTEPGRRVAMRCRHTTKSWLVASEQEYAIARHEGAQSDQGVAGGQLVGAEEE